jgi:hypothetical protein
MGPIGPPETSVTNYHSSLRNNPEQRRPQTTFKYDEVDNLVNFVMANQEKGGGEYRKHGKSVHAHKTYT